MTKGTSKRDAAGSKAGAALEQEIDRLFAGAPDEFVSKRDALARRLRDEKRSEEAARIKALRRPTVAAWAVNLLLREHRAEVEDLLEAGAELRQAQRKALSGVRATGLREATDRRRRAVAALTRAAEEALEASGHGAAATEGVRATLEAASLDEDAAELVRSGRLSRELPPPAGFGGVDGLALVAAAPERAAEAAPKRRGPKSAEAADEEREALRAERDAAARDAAEASDRAARARRAAIRAGEEAERWQERARRLREQAEEARGKARDAERGARQAEVEANRAEDAATRAAARLEDLEARLSAAGGGTSRRPARPRSRSR